MRKQRTKWHYLAMLAVLASCGRSVFAGGGGDQKEAPSGAIIVPHSAQTQPEAAIIRRQRPLGRTLTLEVIALTLAAAVAFLFVLHGVPYLVGSPW